MPESPQKPTFLSAFRPALYEFIWVGIFTMIASGLGAIFLFLYNSESRWAQYALVVCITAFVIALIWVFMGWKYKQKLLQGNSKPNPFESPEYDLTPKQVPVEKPKSTEVSEHKEVTQNETVPITEQIQIHSNEKVEDILDLETDLDLKKIYEDARDKPQPENVGPILKFDLPNINIRFQKGKPFEDTVTNDNGETERVLSVRIETHPRIATSSLTIQADEITEGSERVDKGINFNVNQLEHAPVYSIDKTNSFIEVARQSTTDRQNVVLSLFSIYYRNDPSKFFQSVEFILRISGQLTTTADIKLKVRCTKKMVLYLDEGDELQLKEIENSD